MSIDLTIIAIVFTLIMLLVFFSAVVLYLAFRIKETFKKETKKGTNIAKTAFLIGVIFLAGGIMYFSASTLTNTHNQQTTPTPIPTTISTPTITPTATPTPKPGHTQNTIPPTQTSTTTPSISPTLAPPATPIPNLSFSVFPSTVTSGTNNQVTITFTIYNPTSNTIANAIIQTNDLFQYFKLDSSTSPTSGSTVNVGNVPPGTTTVTLQLTGKAQASATVTIDLEYQGMSTQPTVLITITRGK